jgi:hypothetical protein
MENKEYHKLVWRTAKKDTESYFYSDWKAWVGSGLTGIISGWFVAYLPKLLGEPMPNLIITFVGILFGTIFGLASFVVVLWGWNGFWFMPAKLYREKEAEANLYTWNDISFNPYDFKNSNHRNFGDSIFAVGFMERNKSKIPSHNLEYTNAQIIEINEGIKILPLDAPLALPYLVNVSINDRANGEQLLRWANTELQSEWEVIWVIAIYDNDMAYFASENKSGRLELKETNYKIKIAMHGKVFINELPEQILMCWITCKKTNGSIVITLDKIERSS